LVLDLIRIDKWGDSKTQRKTAQNSDPKIIYPFRVGLFYAFLSKKYSIIIIIIIHNPNVFNISDPEIKFLEMNWIVA